MPPSPISESKMGQNLKSLETSNLSQTNPKRAFPLNGRKANKTIFSNVGHVTKIGYVITAQNLATERKTI